MFFTPEETPSFVFTPHTSVPEHATFFDPSRLCSLLPDDRALHTGDSRPREVDAVDLPPHVAGATDTELAGPPYPIAPRPVASDRASPGAQQHHAWAAERTSERRAEDEGRAVAYAMIVQHAGQRD